VKSRRIVQRIEAQRWTYYLQTRWGGIFWRDAGGPFATKAQATDAQTILRARDDYGGRLPWEPAKRQAKPKRKPQIAGARTRPAEAGVLVTQEELT
jgi:hypothetical protein